MKRTSTIAFLLLSLAASAAAQKTADWIKYTSVEGRYSVSLPVEPKIGQQESQTAEGVKFPQFMASSMDGNGLFMIGYFDNLPNTAFNIDKARDAMVTSMNATLISQDSISLGGSPGRQLKLSAPMDGATYIDRVRIYSIGTRNYVLQCIFPKAEDGPVVETKAAKFFDSFSVKAS